MRLRRSAVLFAAINCTFSLLAQDTSGTAHRWFLLASCAPEIGYRRLSIQSGSFGDSRFIDLYHGSDGGQLGYQVELLIARQLGKRWRVMTGVGYSDLGFRSNTYVEKLTFGNWIDPYAGVLFSTNAIPPESVASFKHYHFLEIPLEFRAMSGRGRMHATIRAGGAAAFLQKATEQADYIYRGGASLSYDVDIADVYHSFQVFTFLGFGATYDLNPRVELFALPTFRYGVIDMFDGYLSQEPWGAHIAFGATWGL